MRFHICIIVVTALMCLGFEPVWGDVVFIVHPSSAIESADQGLIQNIFLGKIVKWPDKSDVSFVLQKESEVHKEFVRTYLKRNTTQFKNYWKKMLFSGKGKIPKSLDENNVIKYVAETAGAIGYVGKNADLSNVKILKVAQ